MPLKVPPKVLKDRVALEKYVHEHIFPRVDRLTRAFLAQYFTIVFSDDFESGDLLAWDSANGSPVATTELLHHGDYSMKVTSNGDYVSKSFTSLSDVYLRFYVRFESIAWHRIYFGGDFLVYDTNSWSWGGNSASYSASLDTWICVELRRAVGSGDGVYQMWIDGVLTVDVTDAIISGNASALLLGNHYGSNVTAYYDCVVIADTRIGQHELFSDGFESGDFTEWTSTSVSGGNTLEVQGSYTHHEDYALHANQVGSAWTAAYARKSVTDADTKNLRLYVMFPSIPNGISPFCRLQGTSAFVWELYVDTDGRFTLKRHYPADSNAYSSTSLSTGVWYCVEVGFYRDASNGFYKLWIDGQLEVNMSSLDTSGADLANIDVGMVWSSNTSFENYIDCVIISDNYIGTENDFGVFADGFESNDFSAWSSTQGSPSIVGTPTHHGSYAMECESSESALLANLPISSPYLRMYVRFTALPSAAWSNNYFGRYRNVTGASDIVYWGIRQATAGTYGWVLTSFVPSTVTSFYEASISINTWYCIEIVFKYDASIGKYLLFIDGELVIARTGVDTTGAGAAETLYCGAFSSIQDKLYVDCVVLAEHYIGVEEAGGSIISVSDAVSLADALLSDKTLALLDSVGVADLVDVGADAIIKTVLDTIGAADAVLLNKPVAIADAVSVLDVVFRHKPAVSVSDVIRVAEAVLVSKLLSVLDSVNLADVLRVLKTLNVSDALSLVDSASTPSRVLQALDTVGITDYSIINKTLRVSENVSLTEIIQAGVGSVKKTRLFLILGDLAIQLTGD